MNLKKLAKKARLLSLILLSLGVSGCLVHVQVKNAKVCAVTSVVAAGADCAYTLSDKREQMNVDELLDFLEPQPERPDPKNPGKTLPERGPAMIMSSDDWNNMKTSLEQACAALEQRCSYETKELLRRADERVQGIYGGTP